jgi:DNA repair exonuclease SbcCD ATPase subunit
MSTLLKFKELQMRNFLSFGNQMTTVDLSNYGSTLIQGENVDNSGANGAGKTTIINAICYAGYNKPLDNISLQRLINSTNSSKNTLMEVRLTFDKGEDEYEIYRCRGETFNIQILKNNIDITLDSVTSNDKLIQEIFGMSYELFTKIIIFSGNSMPFLMTPVAQQRQQIEELFNITMLTEKAIKLKEIIKTTEGSVQIQEAVIKEQESQVASQKKQVDDAELRVARWDIDQAKQITVLQDQLKTSKNVNFEEEKELHVLIAALNKDFDSLDNSFNIGAKDMKNLINDSYKLKAELKHLTEDKCPYCLQQYEGAGNKLIEKVNALKETETKLSALSLVCQELTVQCDNLKSQIIEAKAVLAFSSLTEATKMEQIILGAQEKIDYLLNQSNPHTEAYEQLKLIAIKKINYTEIDDLKREIEHQQFLLKLLTDKNSFIRRRIINRTIPFLNSRLIHYTREIGLPHVVKFDDDMSCTVAEYGRELDFGNLSSGEKKRVNLSLSLAFRDVLHHLHAKVNCLFIDEIDASLDTSGVEQVFKLLKQKTREEGLGLWIISHRPEAIGRFDRTLIIKKENGFSRVMDEANEEEMAA